MQPQLKISIAIGQNAFLIIKAVLTSQSVILQDLIPRAPKRMIFILATAVIAGESNTIRIGSTGLQTSGHIAGIFTGTSTGH